MGSAVSAHNLTPKQELELYVHLHEACNAKLIAMGVLESKVPLNEEIMQTDLVAIRDELKGAVGSASGDGDAVKGSPVESTTEEQVAAATKLQAVQRGAAARKEVEVQQAAATKVQAVVRGREQRKREEEIDKLVKWDDGTHGEEKPVDLSGTPEEEAAATKLQGKVRQRKAEMEVFKKKEHELAKEEFVQKSIEAAERDAQTDAAIALQAAARGKLAKNAVEEKKQSQEPGGEAAKEAAVEEKKTQDEEGASASPEPQPEAKPEVEQKTAEGAAQQENSGDKVEAAD